MPSPLPFSSLNDATVARGQTVWHLNADFFSYMIWSARSDIVRTKCIKLSFPTLMLNSMKFHKSPLRYMKPVCVISNTSTFPAYKL